MATSANSVVATGENWLRSQQYMDSLLLMPEVRPDLIKTYGEQNFAVAGLSKVLGGERFISNMAYRHAEEPFLHQTITVNAQSGASANAAVSFTSVAPSYSFPEAVPAAPFIATATTVPETAIPIYNNMVIEFPSGIQAVIQNVDAAAGTFDAYPRVLGTAIPTTLTTDIITIMGNQKGDRSVANPSRDFQPVFYFGNMMNSDWSYSISGNARQEKTWVSTSEGQMWYMVAHLKEMMRAKNEIEVQLMTSQKTTNTVFSNTAAVPQASTSISTEGMIPFIESFGLNLPYNLISYITLQDWENFVTGQLVPNVAAEEYALYCSSNVNNYIDRFIRAEMKMGAVQYAAFNGSQEQCANFGFRWFASSEHIFYKKHAELFDYKPLLGAAGHKYQYMGLGIPLDKTDKTIGWDDMTTTKNLPQFTVNYQTNRKFYERMLGAMDGVSTTRTDELEYIMNSTYGFEGFAGQRWFTIKKQ